MLNYHHLRYFWLVAHEGNLTRAAHKMNLSQSALSMQIQTLETYLGQPLFERTGRRLVLTEAGHIALDFADAIFGKGEELESTLNEHRQPKPHRLRVGALATLSRNFQISFLGPFLALSGGHMTIRSGTVDELLRSLEAYEIDVVLSDDVPRRDEATRWVAHAIAKQPVSLIGHPSPRYAGLDIAALLQTEALVIPARRSSIRTGFDALVHRLGVTPHIAAEVDDMAMLRLVAREHSGLAIVPPIVVQDELNSGTLIEVAALPNLEETFFAITVPRQFPNPMLAQALARYPIYRAID